MNQSTFDDSPSKERFLTTEEIKQVVSGNTAYGVFVVQNLMFTVYLNPNGIVVGRFWNGSQNWIDRGQWRVADDMLYGKWEKLANGIEFGVRYKLVGNTFFTYQPDGNLNRIQFFGMGNPENLE